MFVKNCLTWVGNSEGRGEMRSDTNPTDVEAEDTETKQTVKAKAEAAKIEANSGVWYHIVKLYVVARTASLLYSDGNTSTSLALP